MCTNTTLVLTQILFSTDMMETITSTEDTEVLPSKGAMLLLLLHSQAERQTMVMCVM
jgi:hypothetical protein